jgi:hypothetical protein
VNQHDLKAAAIVRAATEVTKTRGSQPKSKHLSTIGRAAQDLALQATAGAALSQVSAEGRSHEQLAAAAAATVIHGHMNQLLAGLLTAKTGEPADIPALEEAGRLKGFADETGTKEFTLDDEFIVTFGVPEVAFDAEDGMLVNLRYRVPT